MKDLHQRIVELLCDGVCTYTLDQGKILFANSALRTILGLRDPLSTLIGKNIQDLRPFGKNGGIVQELIGKKGRARGVEAHLQSSKGKDIWVLIDSFAFRDLRTRKKLVTAFFKDITDQKSAIEALRKSQEQVRAIFESTTDCILVWDRNYNYLYANQAAIDHVGTTHDKVIGKNMRDGLGHMPDFMKLWMKRVDAVFESEKPLHVEDMAFVRGKVVYSESTLSPIRDASGRMFAVGVVYRDVTDRKLAEKALCESEKNYRNVVESSLDGIGITQQGKIVYVNNAFCRMFRYREEELLGQSMDKIVAPEHKRLVRERAKKRLLGKREPTHYLFQGLRKDGKKLHVEVCGSQVFAYRGKPAVLGILRDISEQKMVEQALRDSEEKYRGVAESSIDGIAMVQGEKLVYVNNALCAIFGYSQEELLGQSFLKVVAPEHRKLIGERARKRLSGKKTPPRYEFKGLTKDGREIPLEMSVSKVFLYRDTPTFFGAVRDITERKRAEEERDRLFTRSIDMLGVGNFKGYFTQINPAWERTLGWTSHQLTSRKMIEFVHPDDRPVTLHAFKDAKAGRAMIRLENRYRCRNGSYKWLSWNMTPLPEEGLIFGIARDITEGKRAEESLRLQSIIMSHLSEGVYIIRARDRVIVYANPRFEEMFGYNAGELIGKPVSIVNAPTEKSPEETSKEIRQSLEKNGTWHGEVKNIKKDGTHFWCHASVSTFDHPEHGIVWVSVHTDITERKQAEMVLQEKERFLSNVFSSIQDGICTLDSELNIVRVNRIMEQRYAHAMPLVGKKCYEAYHGRSAPCVPCPVCRTLKTGRSDYEVVPKTGAGGKVVGWLDLFSFPLIDRESGRPTGVIEYVRDITERRRIEVALRESEQKYRAIIENASDAILIADTDGNLLELNKKALKLLGYNLHAVKRMRYTQIHPKSEHRKVISTFKEMVRNGYGSLNDVLVMRKDGVKIPVDISGGRIEMGGRKVMQAIFRDISEQKKIQQMKDNLIRDITHELKAPIAMMQMAHTMSQQALSARNMKGMATALGIEERNLRTLRRDVQNILDSYALRHPGMTRRRSSVSLRKTVDEITAELRDLIDRRKLILRVDIPKNANRITTDPRALHTLLYNILDNAVKFTRRGGIFITARSIGRRLWIRVKDTGCGIEAKDRRHVFDKFYKEDPSARGTGLGLSICREIVTLLGGSIRVVSKGSGKGTTAVVSLPRRPKGN